MIAAPNDGATRGPLHRVVTAVTAVVAGALAMAPGAVQAGSRTASQTRPTTPATQPDGGQRANPPAPVDPATPATPTTTPGDQQQYLDPTSPVDAPLGATANGLSPITSTGNKTPIIDSPADNATFLLGEEVLADYYCPVMELPGATCVGTVALGTPVDTASLGQHDFTVTYDSDVDPPESATNTYTVTPPSLAGTITDSGSASPLSGVFVAVLRSSDFAVAAGAVADGSGNFTANVPAGDYFLYLIDPTGAHSAGFFGAPTKVTVTAGITVDADPVMAPTRGSVTATVTETGSGTPIGGVWGVALSASAGNTGATESAVAANGSGLLTLSGLRAGNHFVGFIDPTGAHATRFYPNSPTIPGSTPVVVTSGGSTAANASLPTQTPVGTGAVISGTVTEAGSGRPLVNGRVLALRAADYQIVRAATTNVSGAYTLNLAAGAYKLAFLDATGLHNMEWYDNLPSTGLASAVSVTAPGTANVALDANTGAMAGTIVDDLAADPVPGAWVLAIGPTGIAAGAVTAANGTYTLGGLAPGTYRATFVDPNGGRNQEYWDNSPTYPGATTFNITAANTTTVNADLHHP